MAASHAQSFRAMSSFFFTPQHCLPVPSLDSFGPQSSDTEPLKVWQKSIMWITYDHVNHVHHHLGKSKTVVATAWNCGVGKQLEILRSHHRIREQLGLVKGS